jgi:uncharacterized integral membrane protein
MKFVKMFLALVGLAVLFVFVRDNTGKIVVKFWEYSTPEIEIFLVLIITFVLGMIVASFGSTLKIVKLKHQLKNAGTGSAEQTKESKKDKKSKHKKNATTEEESGASNNSGANYAPTGATAAGTAYATESDVASNTEVATPEADSSAAQPVKGQGNDSPADEVLDADIETTPEDTKTDEVIALPSDEAETKEEGRK